MGLAKRLDTNQSSFTASGGGSKGTLGWQAPELLAEGKIELEGEGEGEGEKEKGKEEQKEGETTSTTTTTTKLRVTKKVDIFALGCLICYVLTGGSHPFGESFEREMNIRNNKNYLLELGLSSEAIHLISWATEPDPAKRFVFFFPIFLPQEREKNETRKESEGNELEN